MLRPAVCRFDRANVGRTAMIASRSEIRHADASVRSAGRSCGSLARLSAMVNTIDEIVIRILAFVSAITLSWT
jgi:hypothetical protein